MATEPKYRPSLTLSEIKALVEAAEYRYNNDPTCPIETMNARQSLKLLAFKAELGTTQPSHIPTGGKPGKPSAQEIIKQDMIESITPEEAAIQISMYQSLGQEVPAHLHRFMNQRLESKE